MRALIRILVVSALANLPAQTAAQARPFPGPDVPQLYQHLLERIENIPAFDHHAHPGFSDDPDVDAMASPPDASAALRTRDDNPELIAAVASGAVTCATWSADSPSVSAASWAGVTSDAAPADAAGARKAR